VDGRSNRRYKAAFSDAPIPTNRSRNYYHQDKANLIELTSEMASALSLVFFSWADSWKILSFVIIFIFIYGVANKDNDGDGEL